MDIYIDKANLKSYVSSSANAAFDDCNRMLRNKFNIHFTFDKNEIEQDAEIMEWMKIMTTGVQGKENEWNAEHPNRPLKSNSHISFNREQLSAVYLLSDDKIQQLMNYGILLYGKIGSEIDILSTLMLDTDYKFVKQFQIKELSNWCMFRNYTSPCSDIILVDQYLFVYEDIYDFNVYSLICELCSHAQQAKVNIVVLTLPSCFDKRTKRTFTPNWNNIRNKIKSKVKSIIGIEPNVTFVLSSNLAEHDRTIFTNYKCIESGDSFHYFDSTWNVISKGRHVEIFSLADNEYFKNYMEFVKDMEKIITATNNINRDNIIGDKKCNYLHFL